MSFARRDRVSTLEEGPLASLRGSSLASESKRGSSAATLMAMGIELVGLDHIVLRVRSLEKAIAFYCGALGCVEERRLEDLGLVQLRAGRSLIDLLGIDAPLGRRGGAPAGREARNVDHFALQVRGFDGETLRAHLSRHGIEAGPVRQLYGAEGVGEAIYIEDPDGNTIELKSV